MISQQLPRFGQCIETPAGAGIVNAVLPMRNGDYLLVVVNFGERTVEKITAQEWNEYLDIADDGFEKDEDFWKGGLNRGHP